MTVYESIGHMMELCAEQAAKTAQAEYGFDFDFSEASIDQLETVLANVAVGATELSSEELEEATKMWGAYFGEVVRRRWTGEWELTQYPGAVSSVPTLIVWGSRLYPLVKVFRRLTMGESENIGAFYELVRAKLLASGDADAS